MDLGQELEDALQALPDVAEKGELVSDEEEREEAAPAAAPPPVPEPSGSF